MAVNPNIDITAIRRELAETRLALEHAQAQIVYDNARAVANQNRAIAITKIECEMPVMALQQNIIDLRKQIDELTTANQKLTREKIIAENALQAIRANMQIVEGPIPVTREAELRVLGSTTPSVTQVSSVQATNK